MSVVDAGVNTDFVWHDTVTISHRRRNNPIYCVHILNKQQLFIRNHRYVHTNRCRVSEHLYEQWNINSATKYRSLLFRFCWYIDFWQWDDGPGQSVREVRDILLNISVWNLNQDFYKFVK